MAEIDRNRLGRALAEEQHRFVEDHPRSQALFEEAKASLLDGVPMNWMVRWAGAFPIFVREAKGAHFTDVDGHNYVDLCLGDTGAMTGHAPEEAIGPIVERLRRGTTFMLPTEDSIRVGAELQRRFGLRYWQVALTATDANRFAIRLARQITGRSKILVHNWCYHGSVDETIVTLQNGAPGPKPGNIGPAVDPALTTKVVEINDVPALEAALEAGDVACVLAEPALTNIGIVHPEPGYHAALREISRRTGTLLIIDETHTICAGPGGYTKAYGLEPDMLTIGKPIASGVPAAVYGFTSEIAERIRAAMDLQTADTGGIGGTLAGNALSLAAIRATLESVLTEAAFAHTIALAERFTAGVQAVIEERALPWHVTRLGCRAEYWFCPRPPRNGGEAAAAIDAELDRYMHLAALNRGILMTPFHNMALIAPQATEADIDRHTTAFRESVEALVD
ncbi:aspartate aminotransferase family protein [Rhodospirillaceae bacterium SYSU D60014]|uniref:aspartate aminotransferase family protein n=1 Tax=Virgifigura deserti TaxID=2268457 RepID=UPI000E669750